MTELTEHSSIVEKKLSTHQKPSKQASSFSFLQNLPQCKSPKQANPNFLNRGSFADESFISGNLSANSKGGKTKILAPILTQEVLSDAQYAT